MLIDVVVMVAGLVLLVCLKLGLELLLEPSEVFSIAGM